MLIERGYTLSTANCRWEDEIKSLGLSANVNNIGTTQHPIYLCSLKRNDLHTVGHGKGLETQSLMGAKYEALEHFLNVSSGNSSDNCLFSYNQAIKDNTPLLKEKVPTDLLENKELHDIELPWVRFNNYSNANEYFYVPLISVCCTYLDHPMPQDKFPYHSIYLNHGENGSAIGCNQEEALVHAILEVLERDAWSLFILRVFLQNQYEYLKLVKIPEELPILSEYVEKFEKEYALKVLLFEIENDFDVFTYGAAITIPGHPLGIKGFGASLSKQHAAERALYEVIQDYFVCIDTKHFLEVETYKALSNWPKVQKCMEFDLHQIQKTHKLQHAVYEPSKTSVPSSLSEYFECLLKKVKTNGFDVYYRTMYNTNNVCQVQTIIPRCEELFTLSMGVLTEPGNRAKELYCNTNIR